MMTKNNNLTMARRKKDDEFYTYLKDIENEVKHYKEHFKGKVVYCNCDDSAWSNFFIYFKSNFAALGLKKLISTHCSLDSDNKKGRELECVECALNDGLLVEKRRYLSGDGDFRSLECIELLKESDIVCTNPPFSLFREYVSQLIAYDKKFLIVGSANAISYKEIFSLIREGRVWLGSTNVKEFFRPNGETKKFGNVCWFTNLQHKKRNQDIVLWKEYSEEEYPKFDNYNAIEVGRVAEIPRNYDGHMAVPITFLEKFNPNQFMICDCNDIRRDSSVPFKAHGLVKDKEAAINGRPKYVRIVIKRKVIQEEKPCGSRAFLLCRRKALGLEKFNGSLEIKSVNYSRF
ncbi:adenosine deaminase [Stenotrophomonas maltophilia]|nr:adenosine deaminase [Stenotrophomonas maltophilia]